MKQTIELSRAFCKALGRMLTPAEIAEAVRHNKIEANPGICHSHDHCDANVAMIEALEACGLELDVQDEAQHALCNAAWDMAKAAGFKAEQVQA